MSLIREMRKKFFGILQDVEGTGGARWRHLHFAIQSDRNSLLGAQISRFAEIEIPVSLLRELVRKPLIELPFQTHVRRKPA
jgi:hypothetical protein